MRRWQRVNRAHVDVRLGYGALGLSAVAFMLVLLTTLVVKEVVVPALRGPAETPAAQEIVRIAPLSLDSAPGATRTPGAPSSPRASGDSPTNGRGQDGSEPATDPTTPDPTPVEPSTPSEPTPPAQSRGPVGSLVDPLAQTLTDTVDQITGGATAPLSDLVNGVVVTATGVVDQILASLPIVRHTAAHGGLLDAPQFTDPAGATPSTDPAWGRSDDETTSSDATPQSSPSPSVRPGGHGAQQHGSRRHGHRSGARGDLLDQRGGRDGRRPR